MDSVLRRRACSAGQRLNVRLACIGFPEWARWLSLENYAPHAGNEAAIDYK